MFTLQTKDQDLQFVHFADGYLTAEAHCIGKDYHYNATIKKNGVSYSVYAPTPAVLRYAMKHLRAQLDEGSLIPISAIGYEEPNLYGFRPATNGNRVAVSYWPKHGRVTEGSR